jgi:hypothetical protein
MATEEVFVNCHNFHHITSVRKKVKLQELEQQFALPEPKEIFSAPQHGFKPHLHGHKGSLQQFTNTVLKHT